MSAVARRAACARSWEVSAARDGRLLQKDLESLQRHLTTCSPCRQEQQQLERLTESLRELPPLPDDVLAARRLRHLLLADANRWVTGQVPAQRRPSRAVWTGAVIAAAIAALAVGYRALRPGVGRAASSPPAASAASRLLGDAQVEIAAQAGAKWQQRQLGDELRIELDAGEIAATIGEHRPGLLVRIQLPDGWIDDLGTVFSVRVDEGHTTSVRVDTGRVRLRLDGHEPVELGAGQNWQTEPVASSSLGQRPPTKASPPLAARPLAAAKVRAATAPSSAISTKDQAAANEAAARQAREEDEAYLHIVALARAHQLSEARAAAKDYLQNFPNGFRREEVLGVATH